MDSKLNETKGMFVTACLCFYIYIRAFDKVIKNKKSMLHTCTLKTDLKYHESATRVSLCHERLDCNYIKSLKEETQRGVYYILIENESMVC